MDNRNGILEVKITIEGRPRAWKAKSETRDEGRFILNSSLTEGILGIINVSGTTSDINLTG